MLGNFTQHMTIMGTVVSVDPSGATPSFTLKTRGGDVVKATIAEDTFFQVLRNLDGLDRDRFAAPVDSQAQGLGRTSPSTSYPVDSSPLKGFFRSMAAESGSMSRVFMCFIHTPATLLFEHTYWWITQISTMGNKWLDDLFGDRRSYELEDFTAFYRTQLNILGLPTDDNVQEMATVSRFIYGLSSAYLMNGDIRFYNAAKAGVEFSAKLSGASVRMGAFASGPMAGGRGVTEPRGSWSRRIPSIMARSRPMK